MWFVKFIPPQFRIVAAVAGMALIFAAGWHGHTIYEGYRTNKTAAKVIKKLGDGQKKIINFNQDFDKGLSNAKDDCLSKPVPDSLRVLLDH